MNMHQVREWINAGCDPEHDDAPSIDRLYQLERDDLIVRMDAFGSRSRWAITSAGWYEADRVQHQHTKFPPGSTAEAARGLGRLHRS